MPIPSSGTLDINTINTEYNRGNTLNNYRDTVTLSNTTYGLVRFPNTSSSISISDFYNKGKTYTVTQSLVFNSSNDWSGTLNLGGNVVDAIRVDNNDPGVYVYIQDASNTGALTGARCTIAVAGFVNSNVATEYRYRSVDKLGWVFRFGNVPGTFKPVGTYTVTLTLDTGSLVDLKTSYTGSANGTYDFASNPSPGSITTNIIATRQNWDYNGDPVSWSVAPSSNNGINASITALNANTQANVVFTSTSSTGGQRIGTFTITATNNRGNTSSFSIYVSHDYIDSSGAPPDSGG